MRGILVLGCFLVVGVACAADEPTTARGAYERGAEHLVKRENVKAVEMFSLALKLDPMSAIAQDRRGDAYLKLGKFAEAIADFDAFLKTNPTLAPEHWRRGIALYYAGRFKDGVAQFQTHKTVNPEDVENAAWHYLCQAKVIGTEKARADLISVTKDRRVPMAEIQKLYAGKAEVKDVFAAAEAIDAKTEEGREARFYANLYVALWYEAEGDAKAVEKYLVPAVNDYKISHYMWDVGAAHLARLQAKK